MSDEVKHSPGPWTVLFDDRGCPYAIFALNEMQHKGAVGCVVRARGIGLPSSPVAHANARLMANAPELLSLCESILRKLGNATGYHASLGSPLTNEIRAVVATVRGEPFADYRGK